MRSFSLIGPLLFLCLMSCNNRTEKTENETPADTAGQIVGVDSSASVENNLSDFIIDFVAAYNSQNNEAIQEFVHPSIGVALIHRQGAMNWYEKIEGIDFLAPKPSYFPYQKVEHSYSLTFDSLPTYDCATETWSKSGFFVDSINQTELLTPIVEQMKEFVDIQLPDDYESHIQAAEANSYRVILTTELPLIFHVKEIDGKWYVTLLDRAYGDCSA